MECLNSLSSALLQKPSVYRRSGKRSEREIIDSCTARRWAPALDFWILKWGWECWCRSDKELWRGENPGRGVVVVGGGERNSTGPHFRLPAVLLRLKHLKCSSPLRHWFESCNTDEFWTEPSCSCCAASSLCSTSCFCAQQPDLILRIHKRPEKSLWIYDLLLCVVCLAIVFNQLYPKSSPAYSSSPWTVTSCFFTAPENLIATVCGDDVDFGKLNGIKLSVPACRCWFAAS